MIHEKEINEIISKICDAIPLDDSDMHFLIYTATHAEKRMVFQKYNEILTYYFNFIVGS